MGYKNREIEKKFAITDPKLTFGNVCNMIKESLNKTKTLSNEKSNSKDIYWKSPDLNAADFVRFRFLPNGTGQLTVKKADRGSNLNRIEIDLDTTEPKQAVKFLKQLFGEPLGFLHKDYFVIFIDKYETNVSVYKIRGSPTIFVEIEARTLSAVNKICKIVFSDIKAKQESRSLYQIFFGSKK